jgi:hypothetical protein
VGTVLMAFLRVAIPKDFKKTSKIWYIFLFLYYSKILLETIGKIIHRN